MSTKISFKFHPNDFENKAHAVEKAEGGKKRRYLRGVSSGMATDLHGERMTEACIKSFHDQATSGDVLLYEGQHGVDYTDDIGKLVNSEITAVGDWMTEYRLYDEDDEVGPNTLEKADKLWKQVNGLPPYTRPKQKGFSIEGDIPDGGIMHVNESGQRVMNDVHLDGVVVVPRPAYGSSIASAVYKALQIVPPEVAEKVRKEYKNALQDRIQGIESQSNYYQKKSTIENGLEESIADILQTDHFGTEREKLEILFDEYSGMMIDLILQHEVVFKGMSAQSTDGVYQSMRMQGLQNLEAALKTLKIGLVGGTNA